MFLQNSLRVGEDRQVDRWRSWLVPPGPFGDLTRLFQEGAPEFRGSLAHPENPQTTALQTFQSRLIPSETPTLPLSCPAFARVSIADTARKCLLMVILSLLVVILLLRHGYFEPTLFLSPLSPKVSTLNGGAIFQKES